MSPNLTPDDKENGNLGVFITVSVYPRELQCDPKECGEKIAKHTFIFIFYKRKKKEYNFSNIQNDSEAFPGYVNHAV